MSGPACVLYDDSCGFCRRWVPFWAPTLARRGIAIARLQSKGIRERLGLAESELTGDIRLLLADGGQIVGADVYRYAMRRIWWAWPIFLLAELPLLRQIFDLAYRTFARNRHRFSEACRLPPGPRGSARD